ncbi:tRNA (N(6)-L-threonylcarbamoyladenosine(37)-C(2))-methylthiotransferase MtaB [Thiocystis minor]|uniref:tRNA (N(6)-L-threonylcarbamoyladenosine(37)-C(2))- methylthiotransferase MtaB n=1 Tax=Thiocystis minor TaxID=61597 RepID=UPI001913CC4E|nr:tRNA (N(6)-L-threonylcarbamoyladenosine(37)-C(2))-methylthiotransferase MtaB [Thiocystis minor]MBK5966125.1 tRNA (N(6)-L-threonylcarbamoyladenosine(37)-C(2))-methylthiotransferase MtaB [Thiocystis minor]
MRVKLLSLGCRLNEAESEDWADRFQAQGCQVVGDEDPADLIVINTCAVTQQAVRKSRQILRRSHRVNPGARLIVSGCLAALEAESLAGEGVDLVVGNQDKDRLVEIALDALAIPSMPELAITNDASPLFTRGRQRAFVKVQDGCRYRCTFCITTQARGEERSRPVSEAVAAITRLHRAGLQEVVLTGVHLGGYGSDTDGDLAALVSRILAETEIPRLRLGSLEPWDLPDDFWGLFADARLMPHLHLPLQSGSDHVLRRMARRCKTDEFARLVARGRALIPDLNITTDIIVGFPGEDVDDWRRTLAFAEVMRFGHIHVFSYSPRAGTLAATLPDQVDAGTKRQRCQDLQALAVRMKGEILRAQIGKRARVLCEGPDDGERRESRFGYTPNYLPVHVVADAPGVTGNRLIDVTLTGLAASGDAMVGQPVRRPE